MSLNCEIVLDLAGRYFDGTASNETRLAVNEHLGECPDCARFYRRFGAMRMQKSIAKPFNVQSEDSEFAKFAERVRLRRLHTVVAVAGYTALVAIIAVVLLLRKFNKEVTPHGLVVWNLFK